MRKLIQPVAGTLLTVAFELSIVKGWFESVPDILVGLLWFVPLLLWVWYLLTHEEVKRRTHLLRAAPMISLAIFVFGGSVLGASAGALAWWSLKKQHERQDLVQRGNERSQGAMSAAATTLDESLPGPGPVPSGMRDSTAIVITPITPKGGAMVGEFTTSGRGEYEVQILGVPPQELLFKPPNVSVEKNKLPVDLLIDGHRISIRKFTDKGFVIFDNGWRDISVAVALVKAASPTPPTHKIPPPRSAATERTAKGPTRLGMGSEAYKDIEDAQVGQWTMEEADKIEELARDAIKPGPPGVDNSNAERWFFNNRFEACCLQDLQDLHTEVLRRLGPPAKDPDEIAAWTRLFPRIKYPYPNVPEMINPASAIGYAPYLRRLGLQLKHRQIPRAAPRSLRFSETQVAPQPPPLNFPFNIVITTVVSQRFAFQVP